MRGTAFALAILLAAGWAAAPALAQAPDRSQPPAPRVVAPPAPVARDNAAIDRALALCRRRPGASFIGVRIDPDGRVGCIAARSREAAAESERLGRDYCLAVQSRAFLGYVERQGRLTFRCGKANSAR